MREMAAILRLLLIAVGILANIWLTPWTWADSPATPITVAVLEFSLNFDIANPDDTAYDRLPAQLASQSLRRLASESEHYALTDGRGAVTESPCTDADCALHVGRVLGVQRVIWGQVTKVSALIWFVPHSLSTSQPDRPCMPRPCNSEATCGTSYPVWRRSCGAACTKAAENVSLPCSKPQWRIVDTILSRR